MTVYRTTTPIATLGSPISVGFARVAGDLTPLHAGRTAFIDAGDYGRNESFMVASVVGSTLTATFARPHNPGVLFSTGRAPNLASTKRHNLVVLSATAIENAETVRKVNRVMRKLLRGVSIWQLARPSGPGTTGPFTIGTSLIERDTVDAWSY
jgi:hypothetical protein